MPGAARVASSIVRSVERRHLEEQAVTEAIHEQVTRWKSTGQWTKLKTLELLFLKGVGNKEVAELTGQTEQQVANCKSDFQIRLRAVIKRMQLDGETFPELAE